MGNGKEKIEAWKPTVVYFRPPWKAMKVQIHDYVHCCAIVKFEVMESIAYYFVKADVVRVDFIV